MTELEIETLRDRILNPLTVIMLSSNEGHKKSAADKIVNYLKNLKGDDAKEFFDLRSLMPGQVPSKKTLRRVRRST